MSVKAYMIKCTAIRCHKNSSGFRFRGVRKCVGCPFAYYRLSPKDTWEPYGGREYREAP